MDETKLRYLEKGIALALVYSAAYLALWFNSLDQWFLPAGLRLAALLFLPYRFWPFLIAGDIAALAMLRFPRASFDGALWSYLSPFALSLTAAVVPLIARLRFGEVSQRLGVFPAVAAVAAVWSASANQIVNALLGGPGFSMFRVSIGSFLGILLLTLPWLLWSQRLRERTAASAWLRDAGFASGITAVLFAVVALSPPADLLWRQSVLLTMLLPAVWLTFRHGWHGSALGVVLSNLAIGLSLPPSNVDAAHDAAVFMGQQALALAATALLVLGWRISEHFERARSAGLAERDALALARDSYVSSEQALREHLMYLAQMQMLYDDERKRVVDWLKEQGHYDAALDLNTRAVQHRRLFDDRAHALYPIRIEEYGLFGVVCSPLFRNFWAGDDTEVLYGFAGEAHDLSMDLQLSAYRCICHAMAQLSDCAPEQYRITMRAWSSPRRRGIAISVRVRPTEEIRISQSGATAAGMLDARVRAHGGILRRQPNRVRFWLSEPPAQAQAAAVARPDEQAPAAV